MTTVGFADSLNRAVLGSFSHFIRSHPDERPYGLAIIQGQACGYIQLAVATEEGLAKAAHHYAEIGYTYQAHGRESYSLEEKLQNWLRWANPDDGWYFEEIDSANQLQAYLDGLREHEDCDERLERVCIDALRLLVRDARWHALASPFGTIIGITSGEDPNDFLRTSTMVNEYAVVRRLWTEFWQANELDRKIQAKSSDSR